jgi:hypothetical protein
MQAVRYSLEHPLDLSNCDSLPKCNNNFGSLFASLSTDVSVFSNPSHIYHVTVSPSLLPTLIHLYAAFCRYFTFISYSRITELQIGLEQLVNAKSKVMELKKELKTMNPNQKMQAEALKILLKKVSEVTFDLRIVVFS